MLLAAAICMALLSGQIQAMGYQMHGLDTFTSYLLGYAPPIVAEVLLALSVSLAEKSERERVQRDSKGHIKDSVASAMVAAFKDIDASRIQRHIDKQVDSVIKAFCDDALGEMMADLHGQSTTQPSPAAPSGNDEPAESKQIAETDRPSIAEMNAERQAIITERRSNIMHLFSTYGEMSLAELQSRLQDDVVVTVAERTLRTDLQALVDGGELVKMGRGRWAQPMAIASVLPAQPVATVNGKRAH